MRQRHHTSEAINFSIERSGKSYSATYREYAGKVTVIYPHKSRKLERSAPIGADALTTARILLRELIADAAQSR